MIMTCIYLCIFLLSSIFLAHFVQRMGHIFLALENGGRNGEPSPLTDNIGCWLLSRLSDMSVWTRCHLRGLSGWLGNDLEGVIHFVPGCTLAGLGARSVECVGIGFDLLSDHSSQPQPSEVTLLCSRWGTYVMLR